MLEPGVSLSRKEDSVREAAGSVPDTLALERTGFYRPSRGWNQRLPPMKTKEQSSLRLRVLVSPRASRCPVLPWVELRFQETKSPWLGRGCGDAREVDPASWPSQPALELSAESAH